MSVFDDDRTAPSGPPRFGDAQAIVGDAIADAESDGITIETVVSVLLCEALSRMVSVGGQRWAADMLERIAVDLRSGRVPGQPLQ
ncbi:hypothetical protein CCR97_25695 [Rhodoplanes elegans]|uniref:Uncharacterized protein n=1 Tax=Rhodoplanes elegans TaxID=29408 RepID=A0A327KJH9_9BRAD|nr:hypothetical protein [Rhodoplanes elegans]MBK5961574.1 hypothetical protein [Rhodoplanes elegans]RAI35448.1 hypothetical protein CH338_19250 [Rhodoplanes elegans]